MPAPPGDDRGPGATPVQVRLLGRFAVTAGDKSAGPWARPSAKRLCELVLVSPGRRIGREVACEVMFPNHGPVAAARALTHALSLARGALAALGTPGRHLLQADRAFIWADPAITLQVDQEVHQERLSSALRAEPGMHRDDLLVLALADQGVLLEDELYADWALAARERLDRARQEARLALARDRAGGKGHCRPEAVIGAWEECLAHDPTCEEAGSALMRLYAAQKRAALVEATYERCRRALETLGLRASPAFDELHTAITPAAPFPQGITNRQTPPDGDRRGGERRLVSVLFAEVAGLAGTGQRMGPEDLRELVGGTLAEVVAEVEAFGGSVTSVSGAGLVGLFGAPESHEDDPERALRAAFRAVSGTSRDSAGLALRAGIETGQVVVGPIAGRSLPHYVAMGEAVGTAAALQSVARPASVLVGPVTRAATEGLFEWGPKEEVASAAGAKPIAATYLGSPKARPEGQVGRRHFAGSMRLVGRGPEMSLLRDSLRDATAGTGGVVVIAGEPGLGKTRLVREGRKLFLAWAGAASGRLPLWLEGRAASYASSRPYGLYRQLLSSLVGVTPEESEQIARPALVRALMAAFGGKVDDRQVGLVAHVMGHRPGKAPPALAELSPDQLQRSCFAAVGALVSRLVSHGPTVLVLEDLHWADPTSLHLTEALSSLTRLGPLLLVLTRRPEPDPGVSALEAALVGNGSLKVRTIELAPLAPAAERALARALLGGTTPDHVLDAVTEGTDGNPLFLEERLGSLLDAHACSTPRRVDGRSTRPPPSSSQKRSSGSYARGSTASAPDLTTLSLLPPCLALSSPWVPWRQSPTSNGICCPLSSSCAARAC